MLDELISKEIKSVEERLYSLVDNTNEVYLSLLYFLKSPSKRIRSKLGILYLKSNDISCTPSDIALLTAVELIHNASLIHDDIIDNSEVRRGEKTIETQFNTDTAVLCGDYLLSLAVEQLLKLNNAEILGIFLDCTKKMADSEITQNISKGKLPTSEAYLDICRGKTACLFKTMLESLALRNGLNQDSAGHLGELFGMVFQIKNDLEPASSDKDKENSIYTARDIFGIEKTRALIDNYFEEMRGLIKDFPQNEYKQALGVLTEELCSIKKN